MASENYQIDRSKNSPTNVDVSGQMRGWFKLIETIRSTDPPINSSNELSRSPPTPPPVPPPKRRSNRHKKITIRKSIKSKESLSDIDQKRQSIDISNSVPFATDLDSLPGNSIDEIRDQRFLDYADLNTLATHFQSCLHIDKKSFASIHFPKQHIFKTRHNALNKIFKLSFLKTWKTDDIDLYESANVSSTSMSFPTDWSVNRRSSSSKPKNIFHILQLNPKKTLLSTSSSTTTTSKTLSIDEQFQRDYEHTKDLLIRTYYPHFHRAFQSKIYFGAKLKPQQNSIEQSDIKKSNSPPPPTVKRHSNKRERKTTNEFVSIKIKQRRVSEEIPSPKRQISYSDSDDDDNDLLPDRLPQPIVIKNGLRSNYYKTTSTEHHSSKITRRSRQFSGSLPPFYTGLFQTDDKSLSYINYQLPYDIYWFSQKNPLKKKAQPITLDDLTSDEKQLVHQTSIFLPRNLRRIQLKRKHPNNKHQSVIQNNEDFPLLIFPQNFYHSKSIDDFQLTHRDLLNLFYNHIRRAHFAKTNRYMNEIIDSTCFYAQLGQLTFVLNKLFDLILNYKCQKTDIYPSNALKKCPLKRLFPMYYELILKPIDLTLIRKKLDQGDYHSYQLFEDDLLLLFHNAITYCGEDSDVGRAVNELKIYFLNQVKTQYQPTIDLFQNLPKTLPNERNIRLFEDFIRQFHEREVHHGLIRQTLAEMIFQIDENPTPKILKTPYVIHCRCGSYFDETTLVQCYACQLWQHVSCVTIEDTSRPYYCFECNPTCEENPSNCWKINVRIKHQQDEQTYSTISRSDGLIIRINECYLLRNHSAQIFAIERLWFDKNNRGYAMGFFYLKCEQIPFENQRKFYSNEVVRLPSTNESISIDDILRPCYVLDQTTFCKGKPIAEYSSRLIDRELFICEYRLDKHAKTFTRLNKSKQLPTINTKSYCFDNYIEKLTIKRESQSTEESLRRRSNKITAKQFDEKSSHIDGLIEKIYCRFHHPNLMPVDTNFSADFFYDHRDDSNNNHNRSSKRLRTTQPITISTPKRRKHSLSDILSSIIDQIIDTISSQ